MAKELYTLLMTSVWDVLALPNAWSQHVATNLFYDLIGPAKVTAQTRASVNNSSRRAG